MKNLNTEYFDIISLSSRVDFAIEGCTSCIVLLHFRRSIQIELSTISSHLEKPFLSLHSFLVSLLHRISKFKKKIYMEKCFPRLSIYLLFCAASFLPVSFSSTRFPLCLLLIIGNGDILEYLELNHTDTPIYVYVCV